MMVLWRYWDAQQRLHRVEKEIGRLPDEEDAESATERSLSREREKRQRAEARVEELEDRVETMREEHEELLLDIAAGRAEVRPRGWGGVPLQPYLIVRHDEEEGGGER